MYDIYHMIDINSTRESLFRAVSSPEEFDRWWTKKSSGDPVPGGSYNFWFSPVYDWYGKVIDIDPPVLIEYLITEADVDWTNTRLLFRIESFGASTCLHFYHLDWKSRNEHFGRTSYCWALYLNGLKKYLEKGITIAYEQRGAS